MNNSSNVGYTNGEQRRPQNNCRYKITKLEDIKIKGFRVSDMNVLLMRRQTSTWQHSTWFSSSYTAMLHG